MPATKTAPDQYTRQWRTQLVLSYVSYPGYARVFRVVPRGANDDVISIPPSDLPPFALEWGPNSRVYAMVNVGAETCRDIKPTAWETRTKLIMRSLRLEDGTGDRVFFAPGLPSDCNEVRVPHIELPEFLKDEHPGWWGYANVMVRPDGTLDRISEFEPPRDPQELLAAASPLPHPYRGVNDSLVLAVAREFEEAGGVWAALTQQPLDLRKVRREMEAVCREHNGHLSELIKEVTGYLALAMQAHYAEGRLSTLTTPLTSEETASNAA